MDDQGELGAARTRILQELGIEEDSEVLFADGFDACILGVVERCGQPTILAYDARKIIEQLVSQGLTYEEAHEHFSFNISGAWVGEFTPCFVWRPGDEEPNLLDQVLRLEEQNAELELQVRERANETIAALDVQGELEMQLKRVHPVHRIPPGAKACECGMRVDDEPF